MTVEEPTPMMISAQTKTCRHCWMMIFFIFSISSCGEFAYKRGASFSDLEIAKKGCKAKDPAPAAIEKCMQDEGWTVQNLNKMEPIDADPVIEATIIPSDQRIENAPGASAQKHPAEWSALSDKAETPAPVKKAPDMLDMFRVGSWWKTGSGADSLKADTDACVTRLGEAHRPNTQTKLATRGLLLCMKEKGWSGLREK
ncbi:MAG: hypothetical protein Q7T94_00775 [Rugosibacter sp.]|jgi:hypothetical protein|nr:hypothetical protein [Rugosibacter sp.]